LTHRVVLVVPDAGPLISLGRADRLDLLLALDLPIWIVDQVQFEATREINRFPDAARVANFVAANPDKVHVFETAVGNTAAARRSGGNFTRQRGVGEAAIAEFLVRLDEVMAAPDDPVMLLYEDSDIASSRFVMPANVHVVSTWSLLQGMEQRGMIASAEAIWQLIGAAGRWPAAAAIDALATIRGVSSAW
jgi:hypothetical protein